MPSKWRIVDEEKENVGRRGKERKSRKQREKPESGAVPRHRKRETARWRTEFKGPVSAYISPHHHSFPFQSSGNDPGVKIIFSVDISLLSSPSSLVSYRPQQLPFMTQYLSL